MIIVVILCASLFFACGSNTTHTTDDNITTFAVQQQTGMNDDDGEEEEEEKKRREQEKKKKQEDEETWKLTEGYIKDQETKLDIHIPTDITELTNKYVDTIQHSVNRKDLERMFEFFCDYSSTKNDKRRRLYDYFNFIKDILQGYKKEKQYKAYQEAIGNIDENSDNFSKDFINSVKAIIQKKLKDNEWFFQDFKYGIHRKKSSITQEKAKGYTKNFVEALDYIQESVDIYYIVETTIVKAIEKYKILDKVEEANQSIDSSVPKDILKKYEHLKNISTSDTSTETIMLPPIRRFKKPPTGNVKPTPPSSKAIGISAHELADIIETNEVLNEDGNRNIAKFVRWLSKDCLTGNGLKYFGFKTILVELKDVKRKSEDFYSKFISVLKKLFKGQHNKDLKKLKEGFNKKYSHKLPEDLSKFIKILEEEVKLYIQAKSFIKPIMEKFLNSDNVNNFTKEINDMPEGYLIRHYCLSKTSNISELCDYILYCKNRQQR